MGKTVTDQPLDQLAGYADEIDDLGKQLKAKTTERNRAVVAAVDDGYSQDAVARAIRRKPTLVTKILAGAGDLIDQAS